MEDRTWTVYLERQPTRGDCGEVEVPDPSVNAEVRDKNVDIHHENRFI